jgi:hypothetical protein
MRLGVTLEQLTPMLGQRPFDREATQIVEILPTESGSLSVEASASTCSTLSALRVRLLEVARRMPTSGFDEMIRASRAEASTMPATVRAPWMVEFE